MPAAQPGMVAVNAQLVGRPECKAWKLKLWAAGRLPVVCRIGVYGAVRASGRCAGLGDGLDRRKLVKQLSPLCF